MTTIKSHHRLVASILCALVAHIGLLNLYIPNQAHIVHPESLAVQRIAVSLGCRPAIENQSEQIQETEPVAVSEPEPEPEPNPEPIIAVPQPSPSPTPVSEPVLKPVLNKKPVPPISQPPVHKVKVTERVKKQPIVKKPVNNEVPLSSPALSGLETDENKDQKETAARVIQEASPLYQLNPPPRYPRVARRRGYEGLVVLEVDVDEYGRPATVTLFSGSDYSLLDKAALEAVRKWRFQPGSIGGIPQKMTVKVPVRFRLDDE